MNGMMIPSGGQIPTSDLSMTGGLIDSPLCHRAEPTETVHSMSDLHTDWAAGDPAANPTQDVVNVRTSIQATRQSVKIKPAAAAAIWGAGVTIAGTDLSGCMVEWRAFTWTESMPQPILSIQLRGGAVNTSTYQLTQYMANLGWHWGIASLDLVTTGNCDMSDITRVRLYASNAVAAERDNPVTIDQVRFFKKPTTTPRYALTYDDGTTTDWAVAQYLASKGLVGSFFIVPSLIGTAGYLTLAQLRAMKDMGHGIYNHSWTHAYWVTAALSLAERRAEFRKARDWMVDNGFGQGAHVFAVPGGSGEWDQDAKDYILGVETNAVRLTLDNVEYQHDRLFSLPLGPARFTGRSMVSDDATAAVAGLNRIIASGSGVGGDFCYLDHSGIADANGTFTDIADALAVAQDAGEVRSVAWPELLTARPRIYVPEVHGLVTTIEIEIDHSDITDNDDATGYFDFADAIPAGAKVLSVTRTISEAFKDTVGENTAVNVMLGDGTDHDRWDKTGTTGDDLWDSTTAASWDSASFQGTVVTAAEKTPRVTFTATGGTSDMTDLISGAGAQGKMTFTITYRTL